MALKETISEMRQNLDELARNLEKASSGNRSAAQRVRTGSIKFGRIAKLFRKESVEAEKKKRRPSQKKI